METTIIRERCEFLGVNHAPMIDGRRGWLVRAFTLIEVLTAMVILALIASLILSIMSHTTQAMRMLNDRVESLQAVREAYDALTRQLSQATLNTYFDYYDASRAVRTSTNASTFVPNVYGRMSDLHFLSGNGLVPAWDAVTQSVFFQTPMGYTSGSNYGTNGSLLNACGFFVAYTSDASERPAALAQAEGGRVKGHYRFRLFRMLQPAESLKVYTDTDPSKQKLWFQMPLQSSASDSSSAQQNGIHPLADNVLALIIWPRFSPAQETPASPILAPSYNYDSRNPWTAGTQAGWSANTSQPAQMHQLPPLLDVTMVAIDESSANRLLEGKTTSAEALSALGISLSGKFLDPRNLESELSELQSQLSAKGVKCRIFRKTIPLRSSKWSSDGT